MDSESGSLPLLHARDLKDLDGEWVGEEVGEDAGEVVCEMVVIALFGGVTWSVLDDF